MEPFFKNDLEHWRSDYRNFKCYLSVNKSDLGHWRSDLNHFKNYLSRYKSDLGHWRRFSDHNDIKSVISASTKVILATEEVVTATLKII